jgi:hypothetical protein
VSAHAAVLALLLAQERAPHGPEPCPRAALANLAGFQIVSKLDFGPRQNRLTAVYVFPDRVRWHFESYGAKRSEHQYFYRFGERVSELDSGGPSRALEGEEHDAVLLQMELRRAVLFWPEGFEWKEEAGAAEPTRSASVWADSCCRDGSLGTLVATLADGRPRRIEARGSSGQKLEALEIRAWQELGGRQWPRTLALEAESTNAVETVEAIETRVHFLDLSFLPPDLRPLVPLEPGPSVMARDLVAMTYSVHELSADLGWDAALSRARELIAKAGEELKPRALAVDPVPTFELSPEGRPRACYVRLLAAVAQAPPGYETHAERAGLFVAVPDLPAVDASMIERVLHATPPGATSGTPYLRFHSPPNPIEIVLPLEPAD